MYALDHAIDPSAYVTSTAAYASVDDPMSMALGDSRRRATGVLASLLDQVGIGVMAVTIDGRVLFANGAALRACGRSSPWYIEAGTLRESARSETGLLSRALANAASGRRTFLTQSGDDGDPCFASVVPLEVHEASVGGPLPVAALILGRPVARNPLGIDAYARQYGLTLTETAVLCALCEGQMPREIAKERGVAMSTIRTQINSILEKSGARSITDLLRVTAMLPPVLTLAS
jgi:DNA-binding CsgD family transcriptional regulator